MQKLRSQAAFTLIEMVIVIAIMGVAMAFAIPSFTRYQTTEEAKEVASRMGAGLRLARSLAVKDGVPYFVIFNPVGTAIPGANPPHDPAALARIVRDADGDFIEDAGERVEQVIPRIRANSGVTPYRAGAGHPFPGGVLINTDASGGALATVVDGTNFPFDTPTTGQPAVGFTTRGIPVPLAAPGNLGAGAGSFYVTDSVGAVFAASVGPLGEVRVRAYSPATDTWR